VRIDGHQAYLVLKGESGDPKVGIGQNVTGALRLTAQPRVGQGRPCVRTKDLEAAEELLRPHQGFRGDTRQDLTEEEFSNDGQRQDRRIVLLSQGLHAPVSAAQELQRAGVNEQRHGRRIRGAKIPFRPARGLRPDRDRDVRDESRTVPVLPWRQDDRLFSFFEGAKAGSWSASVERKMGKDL
jgi:hypothetical protein